MSGSSALLYAPWEFPSKTPAFISPWYFPPPCLAASCFYLPILLLPLCYFLSSSHPLFFRHSSSVLPHSLHFTFFCSGWQFIYFLCCPHLRLYSFLSVYVGPLPRFFSMHPPAVGYMTLLLLTSVRDDRVTDVFILMIRCVLTLQILCIIISLVCSAEFTSVDFQMETGSLHQR